MEALLTRILTFLAGLQLRRYRPRIIGITGNAGKTGTRHAVAAVLAARFRVRSPAANMNTDLGMAAAVIGDFSEAYTRMGGTPRFWLSVLWRGVTGLFGDRDRYPEILVLEYGADHPGDIRRLAARYRPQVAVVTHVGDVPVHVEFFASAKALAAEKAQLVRALPADGAAILNADDLTVLDMRHLGPANDISFGAGDGADVQYTDVHVRMDGAGRPLGVAMNITTRGRTMPLTVNGVLGRGIAAACAAAVAVGQTCGIGLAEAVQELAAVRPPAGRMRILDGIKQSVIVDDTYNASPAAVHLALDTVRTLPRRKLVVLGDMLELGEHAVQAHQSVGTLAAAFADELVCVGQRGRLIAEAAANQLPPERIHWFPDSREAAPAVQRLMRSGDLVLVKGSQGMRMERIVQEVMADPGNAGTLLVRQSARWLAK